MRSYRMDLFIRLCLAVPLCAQGIALSGRSIYRPTQIPQLTTRWVDDEREYHLQHHNLEQSSIFDQYEAEHFNQWLLPDHEIAIETADGGKAVPGALLKQLLENFYKL